MVEFPRTVSDPNRVGQIRCIDLEVCALFAIASLVTGCSTRADDVVTRTIPGTEQLAVDQFCITVSPDEQWLTFVEWRLPAEQRAKSQTLTEYDTRVVSIGLRTTARTAHSIDSISPEQLGLSANDRMWRFDAGFRLIREGFRPPGWVRGSFYFQRYGRGTYLALRPTERDIRIVAAPDTAGTCSDCPPLISVDFHGRTWDLLSNDVSAVVQDGKVRAIYYWGSGPNRVNAVLRVRENSDEQLVVDRHQKQGTNIVIAALRVSPDDRYLAYVVHSKKQEFLAGPREELFIRDLQTGGEKRIASHGAMGNLIWSADGKRLYFAGGLLGGDGSGYVVDINGVFRK